MTKKKEFKKFKQMGNRMYIDKKIATLHLRNRKIKKIQFKMN